MYRLTTRQNYTQVPIASERGIHKMWDHNCNILFLTFLHIMINLGISNASQKSECSWVTSELWSWNSLFVNKAQALFLFTIIDVIFFIQILFCLACNIVQQVILIVKLFVFKITSFLHSTWYVKPIRKAFFTCICINK